jgi:serine/threonine-protein kinase HipA
MISTAFVNIWDSLAGAIAWDSSTGSGSFEFEPSFIKNNWDLSPLKMALPEAGKRIFSFPETRNSQAFKAWSSGRLSA